MGRVSALLVIATAIALTCAFPSHADCDLKQLVHLRVTMVDMTALVPVTINGEEVQLAIDSGAFYSMLSPAIAKHFKLHLAPAPSDFMFSGVNGSMQVSIATVDEFKLANLVLPRTQFLVGGTEPGAGAVGLLGQNLLGWADVEYDLANGVVRLMRAKDCAKQTLAYWTTTDPVSVMDIEPITAASFHTLGSGFLNGKKIRVEFDTGAGFSVLSLKAAERAGIKPGAPGVEPAGSITGMGRGWVKTWIATFQSFKLGGEEIRNARLRFGDFDAGDGDLIIGADFFLSHHIYVSNAQKKLYFTYNGGPVFNLTAGKLAESAEASPAGAQDAAPGPAGAPADAAGFSRRGMAFAARNDFQHALADLDRACELAPQESGYFTERGKVHRQNGQADLALADFDQALLLKATDVGALIERAEIRGGRGDSAGAKSDLDAAALATPREDQLRFELGAAYEALNQLPEAITQFDLWIAVHPEDSHLPAALINRCWARALLGKELDKALSDCTQALWADSKIDNGLNSRGLVRLRRGEYRKAISDYNDSLTQMPKGAWALYGRGLAKLHLGMNAEGQADISAATLLQPHIAETAATFGVVP
jgi:tetratricopeptide (TPR) repeat protein/predicted aspartyl protease